MINENLQLQLRARFNPDGSLLRQHQLRMLEMLKYIDKVCRENDIKYWLCSGTLLGVVRHGGFIPWDDDVDIEMLREDYKKFERVMKNEPLNDYVLQTHQTDIGYMQPFAKLRDLHSYIKEDIETDNHYKYRGCYIDIFIMEPSSSVTLHRLSCMFQSFFIMRPNLKLKNNFVRKYYFKFAFFIVSMLLFPFLRCLSKIGARKQLRHTLGTGFYKPRSMDDIFPLVSGTFEGYSFPIPKNTDPYLQKIYGNYLCLPDLDKIKVHTTEIKFI